MEDNYAISVKNVKKSFKVYLDKGNQLKEKLLFSNRRRYEERHVLNGISFEVKKGEAIGLIGKNGCGKSTTLKILTKIIYPDSGNVVMKGRVSSLIELGAGFHPDMSGRENIYTNAAIFGLTKKEIDERLENIIAFSELEEFIDNPVRTYSSGMYMRLAFSVAINVDADILLIDEILAVGDVNFQQKCFDKIKEIKHNGVSIVIVSHSMPQIEQICDRSIWIENGIIREDGIPKFVHEKYLSAMEQDRVDRINNVEGENTEDSNKKELKTDKDDLLPKFCGPNSIRMGNKKIIFTNIRLIGKEDKDKNVFKTGEFFRVIMNYKTENKGIGANFGIGIFRDDGLHCYGTNVIIEGDKLVETLNNGEIIITIPKLELLPGKYSLDVAIHSSDGVLFDDIRNITIFQVFSNKKDIGVCRLDNLWLIDGKELNRRKY